MVKRILFLFFIIPSFSTANENAELLMKIKALQERVKKLENQKSSGGLKKSNYGNKLVDKNNTLNEESGKKLPPGKMKEMMESLKNYQKSRKEQNKYLEQLMDE